jgi:hypothetical protein
VGVEEREREGGEGRDGGLPVAEELYEVAPGGGEQEMVRVQRQPCVLLQECLQCSAVQCSAVQCSAVQCSAVQCSAVQCSAL